MSIAGHRRPVPAELFGGRLKGCYLLDLEVAHIADLAPRLRSLTFASSDLVGFTWKPGQDLMLEVPDDERTVRRRYTIRRSDAEAGTLDIEVVLHGTGPFARWAATAAIGDHIEGIGPRGELTVRTDANHHLFVGDDSAIPVTFAMLEGLPAGASATALIATVDEPPSLTPSSSATVEVSWLAAGEVIERLQSLPLSDDTVAYVNGERSLVNDAARLLAERGLSTDNIAKKAYWRADQANAAHGEPLKD
jgi:NADPH-dependent ferric siderophore reductase